MNLPLVCLRTPLVRLPHASDRFHTFVLEGVPETQAAPAASSASATCSSCRAQDPTSDAATRAVIAGAAAVVTDDCLRATPRRSTCSLLRRGFQLHRADEQIRKREYAAYTIRPKIHRMLPSICVPCRR